MQRFLDECKRYPRQYTPEWFSSSYVTIGGSEMEALMGSVAELCKKKVAQVMAEKRAQEQAMVEMRAREASASAQGQEQEPAQKPAQEQEPAQKTAQEPAQEPAQEQEPAQKPAQEPAQKPAQKPAQEQEPAQKPAQEQELAPTCAPSVTPAMTSRADAHSDTTARVGACIPRKEINIYESGVPMGWGTMFEPLLCSYIERRAKVIVKGRSISYMPGPFRYSPDGLFEDHAGDCAILELKNPFTRTWQTWSIENNDQFIEPHLANPAEREVPPQYVGQLQLGLHMIECAKYAYFVEAIYRRAPNSSYVSAIKTQGMAKVRGAPKLDSGIIGFYHSCADARACDGLDLESARINPIDFSSRAHDEELCYLLTHLRDGNNSFYPRYFQHPDGVASAHASIPYTSVAQMPETITMSELDDDEDADDGVSSEQETDSTKLYLVGYMPWSLLGVHTVRVDRNPSYISDTLVSRAKEVVDAVIAIKDSPCK